MGIQSHSDDNTLELSAILSCQKVYGMKNCDHKMTKQEMKNVIKECISLFDGPSDCGVSQTQKFSSKNSASITNNYQVIVTRKSSNIYKINTTDAFIQTKYCYEYVYSENAFLKMRGRYGDMVFLDSGGKCDVQGIYSKRNKTLGKYIVTVSKESDNLYKVYGQNLYIRTSMCLNMALAEEAILTIGSYGYGSLHIGNDTCTVEGVYSRQTY